MTELVLRFFIGGIVVSTFAFLGDLFKPKTFAGLFGAAPSVALATLAITIAKDGPYYASAEARSMILGAVAFLAYAFCLSWTMIRYEWSALSAAARFAPLWLGIALALWSVFLR